MSNSSNRSNTPHFSDNPWSAEAVPFVSNQSGGINFTGIFAGLFALLVFLWVLNSLSLTKKVKKSSPTYRY